MPIPSTSVAKGGPVCARLTSMLDRSVSFDLRLSSIRPGGLVGTLNGETMRHEATGPFWAEFKLPDDDRSCECVVRLKHRRRPGAGGQTAVGLAFCGGDEPPLLRGATERARCLAGRRARLAAHEASVVEGE